MKIINIDRFKNTDDVTYDIEVEDNHNFYADNILVSNCHKIKPTNKISKIIAKIKTRNRYGFTGTLSEDNIEKWFTMGRLGPILYEKSSAELRDEKFLTNVEVKVLNIDHGNVQIPQLSTSSYRNELDFIYESVKRNDLLEGPCKSVVA